MLSAWSWTYLSRAPLMISPEERWNTFGGVDLLFNNAGVGAGSTIWESTLEDWTWVIGVNLWGVINGTGTFGQLCFKIIGRLTL